MLTFLLVSDRPPGMKHGMTRHLVAEVSRNKQQVTLTCYSKVIYQEHEVVDTQSGRFTGDVCSSPVEI